MKCLICGKDHAAELCPICGFPRISTVGSVSMESIIEQNRQTIDQYREMFLEKVDVGIIIHHWKGEGDRIVLGSSERISIGSGLKLFGKAVWSDIVFARVSGAESIPISVSVMNEANESVLEAALPNLITPEVQRIGALINEKMELKLMLRSSSAESESEFYPLFV